MKTADLILNLIREEESMTDALKKQAQGTYIAAGDAVDSKGVAAEQAFNREQVQEQEQVIEVVVVLEVIVVEEEVLDTD